MKRIKVANDCHLDFASPAFFIACVYGSVTCHQIPRAADMRPCITHQTLAKHQNDPIRGFVAYLSTVIPRVSNPGPSVNGMNRGECQSAVVATV